MMKLLASIVAALLCIGVLLGFAGWLHPAGDSLSLLRMPLGIACVIWALIRMRRALRLALLGCGTAAALTTVPPLVAGQAGGEFRIYSKNVWFGNTSVAPLARDIRDSGAEVVMLQEVSRRNNMLLGSLAAAYPHQHLCTFSGWNGIAVLSRHPFTGDTICSEQFGLAAAQIIREGQEIWVGSVHFYWPYPYGQERSRDAALEVLARLDGPIVLAGDFNMFPWAASVQQLGQAANARLAGPTRPTFVIKGVPLLLDHVLAPGGGMIERRPLLGSDHRGIYGRVHLTP